MPTTHDKLRELERRLTEAEVRSDATTLDGLATDDFTLVGPAGFVLDKRQRVERCRRGDLVTRSRHFEDTLTRVDDNAAVTVGREIQQAGYQGSAADGEFRTTKVAIQDGSQSRLAGPQLSPIGGPPPFAARTPQEQEQ